MRSKTPQVPAEIQAVIDAMDHEQLRRDAMRARRKLWALPRKQAQVQR